MSTAFSSVVAGHGDVLAGARATVGDALGDLQRSIPDIASKRAYLARADAAQARIAEGLAQVYPSLAFSQLLALRLVNLVVARYHFHHRHSTLASRPIQLMADPVNNCHLSCPGCLHSGNPKFAGAYDWPSGLLSEETFDRYLVDHGALGWGVVFYNWGEPLLNKRIARLVSAAKRYLLNTSLSTNLSLPFDADALVASGLNYLFLSIDGATQATYERFRRGGKLDLVLENVRRIVDAKRRFGSRVPWVTWKYLTFEHNLHEVKLAQRLAEELGVDQFSVATPFGVEWDDPAIRAARSDREGATVFERGGAPKGPLDTWEEFALDPARVAAEFVRPWSSRLPVDAADEESRTQSGTCRWLYQSLTIDARGRLFPCCMAPEHGTHKVYGPYPEEADRAFNVHDLRLSRLAFAERSRFEEAHAAAGGGTPPYCAVCWEKPDLSYTLERDVRQDLAWLDGRGVLPADLVQTLTEWPASR